MSFTLLALLLAAQAQQPPSTATLSAEGWTLTGSITILQPAPCYADCDASAAPGALTTTDLTCFLQRFAAGDAYANCDGSTAQPILTVFDFTCFLQRFAAGCP
jgi:hypothetical protein